MANEKKVTNAGGAPKKAQNNGFVQISKTVTTVLQNDKGVKRTIKETTSAPKKQKQSAKPTTAATKQPPKASKGGKK